MNDFDCRTALSATATLRPRFAATVRMSAAASFSIFCFITSSSFSPATLLAIDHTDTLVLVGASDVPTIKSLKIALETLDLYLETKSVIVNTGSKPLNPFGL